MDSSLVFMGAIIWLLLGMVFGYIASGIWPKGAASMVAAPARKTTAKKAPAKSKSATKRAPAKRKTAAKKKDDLKLISGVGPTIEKKLHRMGVTTYRQIANWKAADIKKADEKLNFKGRIQRENWVRQAKTLASGGQTEFSKRKSK